MKGLKSYFKKLTNNIIVNNILIYLKLDTSIDYTDSFWKSYYYSDDRSLLENVGFSNHPQIIEEVNYTHQLLKEYYDTYCNETSEILDIGCGVGLYLSDFKNQKRLSGVDFNPKFLKKAKELVPEALLFEGNYIKLKLQRKYDLIYIMGVMQYFKPSQFDDYVKKLHDDLNEKGTVFICYSHALYKKHTLFNDLTYVRYSPRKVEASFSKYFDIISHEHFYDKRKVDSYDSIIHHYPNGENNRIDTQRNTYFLFAQKK